VIFPGSGRSRKIRPVGVAELPAGGLRGRPRCTPLGMARLGLAAVAATRSATYSRSDGARPSRGGGSPIQSTTTLVIPLSRKYASSPFLSLFQTFAFEHSRDAAVLGTRAETHGAVNLIYSRLCE